MSLLFKNSLTLTSSSSRLSRLSSSSFLSSASPFSPGRLQSAAVGAASAANLPRSLLLQTSLYSTRPPPAPPLPTDPIYPPPPSSSPSPSPPPLSQPISYPTTPSPSPPKPSKSLLRRLLRLTFLFNTSLLLLTLLVGGSLYLYYSYIAPAKVVYRRGRDGLEYAVGVYGSAKGAVGKGREWYGWMTGEEGRVLETEGGGVVEEEKGKKGRKGWLW